ncbi:Fanconi anemia protein FANCD2, partial [Rhizopus microsporus]
MLFESVLNELGCQLEPVVEFQVERVLFRRNLAIKLRNQSDLLDEFLQDMQTYTEDPAALRKCLLPSTTANHVSRTSRTTNSESLFKTLLAVDSIQSELITYLLERLPEFYDELENDNSSSCTARLILNQLRWLDYIAQPEALTEKLIEIIQITPSVVQHEIITSLPDIINDSEHKPIVVYLKELMNENSELTVPILDALSNLTLHSESLDDVKETVLDRLESAELDDIAVILKFMLQTVTPNTVDMVILGIRQKLDFRALGKIQQDNSQRRTKQSLSQRSNVKDTPEALILESIKLGLQFHKFVCEAWFRTIMALETARAHKIIDVLILFILYSMPSMKKKAESAIKKKIIQGLITAPLLEETIMCHASGLASYWNVILSLSEGLLRSCQQNGTISPCASTLYISSFKVCDSYYRQEIIGSLVTHIGSGVEAEMSIALNVLLHLAKSDVSSVTVYSVFIKGILDYLDNLSLYQIRILFDIFSLIALTSNNTADGSGNLWADIQIVIRKQLSNPREKYKNIGIIASLSAIRILGSRERCSDIQSQQGGSSSQSVKLSATRHPLLRQSINILDSLMRNCNGYPACISLCYDELAHIFSEGELDERLEEWIKVNLTSDFTEYYLSTVEDTLQYINDIKKVSTNRLLPSLQMNADEEDGVDIVVKLYELIARKDIKSKKNLVVPMCSTFNLMQICEKQLNNGSLEGINALSGCSILLFESDDLDELSPEELFDACDILFYTINWIREVLNSFVEAKDEDLSQTLIVRLRHILELESRLNNCLKYAPNYVPFEFHNTLSISPKNESSRPSQIIDNTQVNESQQTESPSRTNIKKETRPSNINFGSISELRSYMRAFNLSVFEIFKHNTNQVRMTYAETSYILEDLNNKLDIKIVPASVSAFGRKKVTSENKYPSSNSLLLARIDEHQFMKKISPSLPYILQTLEDLYADIQQQGIDSGRIGGVEEIAKAISLIFNVIFKMLSWSYIQSSDNKIILETIIQALAERISGESKQNGSSPEAQLRQAFQYLCHYGANMPQSTTAVLLFKILLRIMELSDNPLSLKQGALSVVNQIVSTSWFDWRDIKKEIEFLIEKTIELDDDPLQVLHNLVNDVLPRYEDQGPLEDHPLLKSDTVVQYYQAIISQIVNSFELFKSTDQEPEIVLVQNGRIVKIFERITHYVKVKEHRLLIGVLLKTGKLFIDQFTKHSIPYFTEIFKAHKTSILAIFKDLQASTRVLQIICSHVKVLKDVSLSAYVPPLKRSLENIIYQVKMLVTRNGIPAPAFFMGALKHRDITGAEISSQVRAIHVLILDNK